MRHPDCHCKRAIHEHGSRTTYIVHGCRCDACRADNARMQQARARRRVQEQYQPPEEREFIDGDLVRAHLRKLMAAGMGWKRIARAAGLHPSTVGYILYGYRLDQPDHPEHRPPRKQVRRRTAERLLAVRPKLADGARVDATGTRRRIRALVAIGWTLTELGHRLGITRNNMHLYKDRLTHVTVRVERQVRALYDELWDQPLHGGHHDRIRRLAAERGWLPPLAWDDDTIDDPDAVGTAGGGGHQLDADELRFLVDQATDFDDLARITGNRIKTLQQSMRRAGIETPARFTLATEARETYWKNAARPARRGGVAA